MHNEQVFTPEHIVNLMLDYIDYRNLNIRGKHIMDNSCGNGNFVIEIVRRYIEQCIKDNLTTYEIRNELSQFIHGIEIDETLYEECISRIDKLASEYDVYNVKWDIVCSDALIWKDKIKCDYVVGNPPYCNVHHFKENYAKYKQYNFAQGGMTDLYLIFFELGISMLNENGKLCYITPNSWMTSIAGKNIRQYLYETNKLSKIIQCGSNKIFKNATTFTTITLIDNKKTDECFVFSFYDEKNMFQYKGDKNNFIKGNIYLTNHETLELIKEINKGNYKPYFKVKNGFATLNDKMFVLKDKNIEPSRNIIKCVKASTCEECRIIFPYTIDGKPMQKKYLMHIKMITKMKNGISMEEHKH